MSYYVQVIGSYDASFVGPFAGQDDADRFAKDQRAAKPQFSFYPMTEADMRANIAEFGECSTMAPADFS